MKKEITKKLIEAHHALYRVTDLLPQREPLRKMLRENANALLTYIIVEADFTRISADANFMQINTGERGIETVENMEFRIKAAAKIEALQNMLTSVKDLDYCHPVNFEVLEREYAEITRYFETRQEEEKKASFAPCPSAVQAGETLRKKEDDFVKVFEGSVAEKAKKEAEQEKQPTILELEYEEKPAQNNRPGFNERKQAIISFIKERKEVRSTELATIFSNRFSLKTLQRDLAELIGQKAIDKQGEKRWAVYRMNPVRNLPLYTGF